MQYVIAHLTAEKVYGPYNSEGAALHAGNKAKLEGEWKIWPYSVSP